MDHPVRLSLLFMVGLALGFLLMPISPELGGIVIIVSCSVVLIAWLRGSPC